MMGAGASAQTGHFLSFSLCSVQNHSGHRTFMKEFQKVVRPVIYPNIHKSTNVTRDLRGHPVQCLHVLKLRPRETSVHRRYPDCLCHWAPLPVPPFPKCGCGRRSCRGMGNQSSLVQVQTLPLTLLVTLSKFLNFSHSICSSV